MERAGFPSRVPLREDALQTARLKLHPPFGAADLAGSLRAVRELTALLFSDFTYQYNILFYIIK